MKSKIISHPASLRAKKSPLFNFFIYFSIAIICLVIFFFDGFDIEKGKGPAGLLLLVALLMISIALHFLMKKSSD